MYMNNFKLQIVVVCILVTILAPIKNVFASNLKGFVVLSSSYNDLVIADGYGSYYKIGYSWDCSSSDFSTGETFWIDTYYSPGYGNTILVQGMFDTKACTVNSVDSLNLKKYFILSDIGSDQILVEDTSGYDYLVEYGIGCLSMWRYENKYIYIDIGGYSLDGISDTIYLFDSDDECRVWSSDSISTSTSSSYTYSDITAPDFSSATASVYADSSASTLGSWQSGTDSTPFFTWQGVSDASGVAGYYVYLGTSAQDPYTYGTYQTTNGSLATLYGPGTYYLNVSAVDLYGNRSSYYYWTYSYSIPTPSATVSTDTTDTESIDSSSSTDIDLAGAYDPEKLDTALVERLSGSILLQVEEHGEAWYIYPSDSLRYYMKDGTTAYNMMRSFGLGITNKDLETIPSVEEAADIKDAPNVCLTNKIANQVRGTILLQVEQHGEAWYVDPATCTRVYMKDGSAAYSIMRELGLGITNTDLTKLPSGSIE